MIDPAIAVLIEQHLTFKQAVVFELHHRTGMSIRAIAVHLGIARSSAVDRYDAACLHLHRQGVRFTPDGHPYLEETDAA